MTLPKKSWIGKMVIVTWEDPSGFINSDLSEVKLSTCESMGILISFDAHRLILRTSKYEGSDVGDYTAITMGCCSEIRLFS